MIRNIVEAYLSTPVSGRTQKAENILLILCQYQADIDRVAFRHADERALMNARHADERKENKLIADAALSAYLL